MQFHCVPPPSSDQHGLIQPRSRRSRASSSREAVRAGSKGNPAAGRLKAVRTPIAAAVKRWRWVCTPRCVLCVGVPTQNAPLVGGFAGREARVRVAARSLRRCQPVGLSSAGTSRRKKFLAAPLLLRR
jgi:hypothetical protein